MLNVTILKNLEENAMEKRKNVRLPLRLLGHLSLDGKKYHATETRDISLNGGLFRHALTGCTNRPCTLNLFTAGTNVFSITIEGWTVYESDAGCGIKFLSMDAADFVGFKEFLANQVLNPHAIHREYLEGPRPQLTDRNRFLSAYS
jgi:hypothetical protein